MPLPPKEDKVEVPCPGCNKPLKFPNRFLGRWVNCPECECEFTVELSKSGPDGKGSPFTTMFKRPKPS